MVHSLVTMKRREPFRDEVASFKNRACALLFPIETPICSLCFGGLLLVLVTRVPASFLGLHHLYDRETMKALTAELVFSVLLYKFCQGSVCDVILCGNGGSCVAEEFDFSEHQFIEYGESQQSLDPLNDEDVIPFHCECPSNWTGRLCDISFMRCSGTHNC